MSLPVNVIGNAVSSSVDTFWLSAVGASFTGSTVMDTVAVLLSSVPSFTLNVKESAPL